MKPLIYFVALLSTSALGYAQESTGTSTVTFGVGAGWRLGSIGDPSGGPQFNGTYEYRLRKHLALEGGIHTTVGSGVVSTFSVVLPGTTTPAGGISNPTYIQSYYPATSLTTTAPFGVRGILPLSGGRVELIAGGGGAYVWHSLWIGRNGWAAQGNLGVRFAVDKQRHFWMGTTGRLVGPVHGSNNKGEWLTWTADFGFRFGH